MLQVCSALIPMNVRLLQSWLLVEVLLVLVLLVGLMLTANQFIFSVSESCTNLQGKTVFSKLFRAATNHVVRLLGESVKGSQASDNTMGTPAILEIPLPGNSSDFLLTFDPLKSYSLVAMGQRTASFQGAIYSWLGGMARCRAS